jgi:hypothetical protein
MEATNLPKVSKILSSKAVSESTAFQAVASFLEKEQKRLDSVAIQQANHLNDAFLVCEALAQRPAEKDQLERLRNSSTIKVEKEFQRFHPSKVESSSPRSYQPLAAAESTHHRSKRSTTSAGGSRQDRPESAAPQESPVAATLQSMIPVNAASEPAAVKQEIIADEQPSAARMEVDNERAKRKAGKKAKKEKKKKHKGHNNA